MLPVLIRLEAEGETGPRTTFLELLKDIKPENLALVKKHLEAPQEAWGKKEMK